MAEKGIQVPELQAHDVLTALAQQILEAETTDGRATGGKVTAAAVFTVVDPNPSSGFVLVTVVGGKTRAKSLDVDQLGMAELLRKNLTSWN